MKSTRIFASVTAFLAFGVFALACDRVDFSAHARSSGADVIAARPASDPTPSDAVTTKPLTTEEVEKLKQDCWFAVSGTWMGAPGAYDMKFPQTTSGRTIAPGEGFDSVGGVFLSARETPYEYGKGGKEIDVGIEMTFDSIAVAPGMHVTIKSGEGVTLFDADGPVIGESSHYANLDEFKGKYYAILKANDSLPAWMKEYVKKHVGLESVPTYVDSDIPLSATSAKWVKVSVIPNAKCDVKDVWK